MSSGHEVGGRDVARRRVALVLPLMAVYTVAEVVGGWLTNSLALLADAGHMLSDVAALGLTLFAMWVARRPATATRTFGYYRAEILAALANGATLVAVAVYVFIEAWQRLRDPPAILGGQMLAVAMGGLVVNVIGLWVLRGSRSESLNVRGAWLHVLGNALGSLGAIASGAFIWAFEWNLADPIASVIIGLLIPFSAWELIKEAVAVLMESVPGNVDLDAIAARCAASMEWRKSTSCTSGRSRAEWSASHVTLWPERLPVETAPCSARPVRGSPRSSGSTTRRFRSRRSRAPLTTGRIHDVPLTLPPPPEPAVSLVRVVWRKRRVTTGSAVPEGSMDNIRTFSAVVMLAMSACASTGVLTQTEMRMTADEHERAAALESFHAKEGREVVQSGSDHERRSAEHRAAAQTLREAEASACVDVREGTEAVSPFAGLTVEKVERIDESWGRSPAPGRGHTPSALKGAVMTVHSDLATEATEARLKCSVARARARGDDGTNPVAVHGATVRVREIREKILEIHVRADDDVCAKEVLRRAEALVVR